MNSTNKHLGCAFWYEVYLMKSTLDGEMWNNTLITTLGHLGALRTLKVAISIENNLVRYFFGTNKDITELSNALDRVSLRPVDASAITPQQATATQWMVQPVAGGNILDIRERIKVNRNVLLEWSIFSMRELAPGKAYVTMDLIFKRQNGIYALAHKRMFGLPGALIAINFRENEKYAYKKYSKHLDIKKSLHILRSEQNNALMEVETYPYMPRNAFLDLSSYDFDKHSFIIGSSGSGKSKFISLFIDRLLSSPLSVQYRVVVIDPHAALEDDLGDMPGATTIRFSSNDDRTELFASGNTDISASTELTTKLFESLLGKAFTTDVERVLRYSMNVLMTAQVMSLDHLKRFLTDEPYRLRMLQHVSEYVPANIEQYFSSDYLHLSRNRYTEVVTPIVELVDEIQVRVGNAPSKGAAESSLAQVVESNRLTVFSLNKVGMGEKALKTVSGLLIQQLFLLAQARQFNEKIILIIDEVSLIQNPTISQILAEARKYNMFIFLSQQYFGQVDEQLRDAIFSNVINYYVFKVSEHDARLLEGNITMELPRKMTMEATRIVSNQEDLRVPMLTSLNNRECIVRVSSEGKILPAVQAKTLDFVAAVPEDGSPKKLVAYKQRQMPEKFLDSDVESSGSQLKPTEIVRLPTMNLMEILSQQSSHRNEKKEK